MYKIVYLPIAKNDLKDIVSYISNELNSPKAALNLIDALDSSVSKLQEFPLLYREYEPVKPLLEKHRIIPVKNYIVLYVVLDNVVEIRRIIYAKKDYEKLL
jgi:toxin ParE1/3/4